MKDILISWPRQYGKQAHLEELASDKNGLSVNKIIELTPDEIALISFALGAFMGSTSEEGAARITSILKKMS
jgi:hypothetical protein